MIYSRFIGKISIFFGRFLDILPIRFDTYPVLIGKLRIISDRLLIILPINRVMFCSLIGKSRILSCCQMVCPVYGVKCISIFTHTCLTAINRSLDGYNVFYLEHDKKLLTINLLMIYL